MRIVHVTNGLDAKGRFGGVQVVVLDLARALIGLGHRCIIVSGRTETVVNRRRIGGVGMVSALIRTPVPRLGPGGQVAPLLLARAVPALAHADVVHIHFSRDLTSLSAALIARALRRPLVLQTHGMLDAPGNAVARLLDRTVVPVVVRSAVALLVLGKDEHAYIRSLRPRVAPERFSNGTAAPSTSTPVRDRAPEILFLARLHPRKGAVEFTRAAIVAARSTPDAVFVVAGPDEGDLAVVQSVIDDAGLEARFRVPGGLSHQAALGALGACRLFVLPARREPFGMTVIEAMVRGTPVVVHESAELAPEVTARAIGWTFSDEDDLARLIVETIGDLAELDRRGAAARAYAVSTFGIDAIAHRLEAIYERSSIAAAPAFDRRTRVLVAGAHPSDSVSMHRATTDIVRGYRAADVDATVVDPTGALSARAPKLLRKPVKYFELLVLFPLTLRARSRAADVVHVADHSNAPWLLLPGLPRHRIVTVHDLIAQRAARGELVEHVPKWPGRIYQKLIAAGLRRATVLYPVSETTRADAQRLFPRVPTRTLRNAVDVSPATGPEAPVPGSEEYLLVVSTGGWRKQRWVALQIWAALRAVSSTTLRLRIVGPALDDAEWAASGLSTDLRSEVQCDASVPEAELLRLYRGALALLQTSRYEGFGWPIIEANAAGTPALLLPEPVFREIGGEAGVFVELKVPQDWAGVLTRLRLPEVAQAARENATRFSRARFERDLAAHLRAELTGGPRA